MSIQARVWLTPGVLLWDHLRVPSPPPRSYRVVLMEPYRWFDEDENLHEVGVQEVEFRLTDSSETGEVAHYELVSRPKPGWRWVVHEKTIRAERIPEEATR